MAEAGRLRDVLRLGADAIDRMLAGLRAQFEPPAPARKEKPKP